jgi:hypothetical protein
MAYADYTYYTGTYLGTAIASADFAALALQASAFIDQITFDRAAPIVTAATDTATITKIKNAMCAVAEQMQTNNAAGNIDGIASESVGNHSVSYNANASQQQTSTQKNINAAGLWLSNTSLLFRGFADGEYSDDGEDEDE